MNEANSIIELKHAAIWLERNEPCIRCKYQWLEPKTERNVE